MMAYLLNKPVRRNEILTEVVSIPLNPPKLERQTAYVVEEHQHVDQNDLKMEEFQQPEPEQKQVEIPEPEPMQIDFISTAIVNEPPKKYLSAFELASKVKK